MTKFQIVSDLHIEYKSDKVPDPLDLITPSADILILAGDIGSLYKYNQLKVFLEKLCVHFQIVLYVPGNHEYYIEKDNKPISIHALNQRLNDIEKNINNLYVLSQTSVKLDGKNKICIAGATLWSKPLVKVPRFLVRINNITTQQYENLYKRDRQYIEKMIRWCQKNDYKLIVITHHCPTYELLEETKKRKNFHSLYATNLTELLEKNKVHTWICGHIHKNFDITTEEGTHIVSNQKGKPKDKIKDYRKDFTIVV